MNQFSSMLNVFAYNYLKLNLIGFDNCNGINLSSYLASKFLHLFFLFWWSLHTQKLQSFKYAKLSLILILKMIPTCFTTQFLAFNIYKGESSNSNLSFHKQLKEALQWEQKCVAAFENRTLQNRMSQKKSLLVSMLRLHNQSFLHLKRHEAIFS